MSVDDDLARARREADDARERMLGAAHKLQARLKPAALAETARDAVCEKGAEAAEAVKRRPLAASAVALGVVAFTARRPLARLIGRLRARRSTTETED